MAADLDLDALLAPARWEIGRCAVAQSLERIGDEKVRARVAVAAADSRVRPGNLLAAIEGLIGYAPGETTVKRHRRPGHTCQ